ncbi:MAG: methyltransferase domain-containing protein [Alphaproteobacteria bacterium]|nr:methyltransferase domain-containing protein [Alphaproteobacteria bacterium]
MAWNPTTYLRFASDRERPLHDLVARVPLETARAIVDLGCGTGNSTAAIAARYPQARLTGIESSSAMLAKARASALACDWREEDIAAARLPPDTDLVFSNAALHWLDDHECLFARLASELAPGGALAVQMPDNFASASHALIRDTAREEPWADRLAPLLRPAPVLTAPEYARLLAPQFEALDIWTTEYLHRLEGEDAVLNWVSGTALVPLMAALAETECEAFRMRLSEKLAAAYPREPDGTTLFPFRRLFVIAAGRR